MLGIALAVQEQNESSGPETDSQNPLNNGIQNTSLGSEIVAMCIVRCALFRECLYCCNGINRYPENLQIPVHSKNL